MQSIWVKTSVVLSGVLLLSGLLLVGCEEGQQQAQKSQQLPAPEVAVVAVRPQPVALTTELPGRTTAYRAADIRPQVSGLLEKRLFSEGADVTAGQVLYRIDPAPFQAAVDSAAANLLAQQKAADRARAVLVVSEAEITRRQATLSLAKTNSRRFEALV